MIKQRGKLEQIIDFLEVCRRDPIPTHIFTGCHMNMTEFKQLASLLQGEGYLECYPAKPKQPPCRRKNLVYKRVRYRLTEKGVTLLKVSTPLLELKRKLYSPESTFRAITVNCI